MFVLLASPLVGPSVWTQTAAEMTRRGHRVASVDLRAVVTPTGPDLSVAVELVEGAAGESDRVVLVPHSGAGPLTPFLLAEITSSIGAVFVDAGVPPAGASEVPLAPPDFLPHLRSLADGSGTLPPWASWWGEEAMAEVVPDADLRERLRSEMRPLPLGYFTSSVPVPRGWPALPGAFLAFGGEAYALDLARVHGFGWPSHTLPHARHLHPAIAPADVAEQIASLALRVFG